MLTEVQKSKADDVAKYTRFKDSEIGNTLASILAGYRLKAIQEIEANTIPEAQLEGVRSLHAVNKLIRHRFISLRAWRSNERP